jgi:amidase
MRIRLLTIFALIFAAALARPVATFAQAAAGSDAGRVVKYRGTTENVKYVYGTMAPVEHLRPGDILETNTLDAFGDVIQKPGDTLSMTKGDNPLTGPFYIDGAEPGDTIAIKILSLDVNSNQGVGGFAPGFGALNSTDYTPMLNPAIPERLYYYPVDHASHTASFHAQDSNFTVNIPLHEFLGCIGVAPAGGEARSSVVPAEFGGNMDSSEVSVGNILYLPVNVAGALLFMGDGHAAMGDGEVSGSAIEVPLNVRLTVDVIKHKVTKWPRFENENEIMAAGIYRPLDDCLRIAFTELVKWMHEDYGLSELDSYELLSKSAKIHLAEMVDPNYVIIAKIDKKFLPPKKK